MKYKIYPDSIKLFASYLVPKGKFTRELNSIRNLHPTCRLWERSNGNIRREWASHNLAYAIGYKRDRTKDCDLDFEPKWYHNLAYFVVGTIALLVIK